MNNEVKLLDCTIRDGGYSNNWDFSKKMVREVYRALSKSGIDIVEIGFRGSDKYFDKKKYGLWRFSKDRIIKEVTKGIRGAKLAVMGDFGKIEMDDFVDAEESMVDLVRVAVHKNNLKPCVKLLEKIKQKGYSVSLNAMGYTSYSKEDREDLKKMVTDSNLDYLYMADSYGSIFPDQMASLFEPLLEIPNIKLGFHPHNNLQMAFANSLEAIKLGVHIVDCTLYGIGRAAGNLSSEVILLYLELSKGGKYNVVPILNCIDTYLLPLKKEKMWGYQLPYMLSGMYKCHPSYADNLVKYRQFNVEDICVAMDRINKINPVGYSKEILDKIISGGMIGKMDTSGDDKLTRETAKIPYIDRHKGREFLVLANGPNLLKYKKKIDQFIEKYDPIILGTNNLDGLFIPHYHAFTNKRRFAMYADSVSESSSVMVSQHFDKEMIKEYTTKPYEWIYYNDRLDVDFDIKKGIVQCNCRTTSVLLLGIAILMGAERVFAAGLDGYMSVEGDGVFFYNEPVVQKNEDLLIELHQLCYKFIEQIDNYLVDNGKDGVHILTPTGYRSCYKGIDNYI